jgi:hypothetical protein
MEVCYREYDPAPRGARELKHFADHPSHSLHLPADYGICHRSFLVGCIAGRDKVGGKTDVAQWNVEIMHDGLGEAPYQGQALMLKEFLEITLIELSQPAAEAVHHRNEQLRRSREHPPYFVARNAGDNSVCLRYRGGGSRF